MKLVSYLYEQKEHLGLIVNDHVHPTSQIGYFYPDRMRLALNNWEKFYPELLKFNERIINGAGGPIESIPFNEVKLLPTVTQPESCRDGYAFRQHVESARRNRGLGMIPEFDQFPIFYFTNHKSIQGPGAVRCMPDHFEKLDFELEAAIVICKEGINIKAKEADNYIAGLMIMNDMSARHLQREEMLLNLGPAKGKDFSTAIGPWLVTLDELKEFVVPAKENHTGLTWNLQMECKVNGEQVSAGNLADMDWTFAEIIERASYGTTIYPGDIIGSGTVGTGCFMELNGTKKLQDPNAEEQWLKAGDHIEMTITGLGSLSNHIIPMNSDWSILSQKKNYDPAIK